jgi:protease-4
MRHSLELLFHSLQLFWKGLDQARRATINILFLIVIVLLIGWWIEDDTPEVAKSTALVLAPYGDLVEELSGDTDEKAILALLGERQPETLMRSLLESIEMAKTDDRIQALVLDTERMGRAGLSKLQTLREAIESFQESGKKVIATADYYSQTQYYLASVADEVFLHPMGMVMLTGYGSYRNYYKEALDHLEVDWHVFRVGEYKSAVEPYLRSDMSPEAREARRRWLSILWQAYMQDVETGRALDSGSLDRYASSFADLLAEHDGDAAAVALAAGLVDRLAHRDEVRQRLIELVGEDEDGKSFSRISHGSYLRAVDKPEKKSENKIAIVVAKGGIYDGSRAPGRVGGDSTARMIRQAREDEDVKALVLRVDSPGGSAFASEIIRREVELTREAGKPGVASMGSVAASGGYWISMSADEIWARPTTITGSIGIYAMFPTYPRTLAKLGVKNDGVGTGVFAGTLRPDRPLPEEAARAMELMIEQGYQEFIQNVAAGRNKTVEEVDQIARGRVWAGSDALELGLVDQLGEFDDAVAAAAVRADLGDDYRIEYLYQSRDWRSRLLDWFVEAVVARVGPVPGLGVLSGLTRDMEDLVEDLSGVEEFGDPSGFYAYCFCEPN